MWLPWAFSSGWASGVSAYLAVLQLGILGRLFDADGVPDALMRTDVMVAAGVLYAVEFVTDKIPYVDSAWDTIHTVIRPLIGTMLGLLVAGDADTLAAGSCGGDRRDHRARQPHLQGVGSAGAEPLTGAGHEHQRERRRRRGGRWCRRGGRRLAVDRRCDRCGAPRRGARRSLGAAATAAACDRQHPWPSLQACRKLTAAGSGDARAEHHAV